MVACSPLRRCIGTAMMVAAAAAEPTSARVSSVKFVLPTENNVNGQEQIEDGDAMDTTATDNETSTTIPMLVMNGLGDCAAQMGHMGGIGKAVKAGWLACAASPGNHETNSATTPLQNSLETIADSATCLQTRWGSTRTVTESCKLQFWRESKYHYFESAPRSDFSRMTEPRTLQEHGGLVDGDHHREGTMSGEPSPMPKNAPSCDERFDQAVERAVLQTAHAGLDTCILVTHREAIRWIETHWVRPMGPPPRNAEEFEQCRKRLRRDSKLQATRTYCCVGDYQVTVDLTNSKKPSVLSWETKKIVPWSELEKDHE